MQQIATVFSEDIHDFYVLTQGIKDFRELCLSISKIDIEADTARQHIYFDNGFAVGMT